MEKIAKGVNKIRFTMLYSNYCYIFIEKSFQKFSPYRCRLQETSSKWRCQTKIKKSRYWQSSRRDPDVAYFFIRKITNTYGSYVFEVIFFLFLFRYIISFREWNKTKFWKSATSESRFMSLESSKKFQPNSLISFCSILATSLENMVSIKMRLKFSNAIKLGFHEPQLNLQ